MEKPTFKNLLVTKRDAEILSLVAKLKIAESDLIRDLVSPGTSQNTFTKRLKKMERKWYLKPLGGDFRSRSQNKLYGINPIKRKEVEEISGTEALWGNVDMSHSNYYHTLYIGYFLRFIVANVRKKRADFKWNVSDFHSQYEIRKIVSSLPDNGKGAYAIPDWLLKLWNAAVFVEIERRNSPAEFSKKVRKYKDRWFHLSGWRLRELAGNVGKYKLFITAPNWKLWKYREILEKEKIRDYYDVRLMCEDRMAKA